ncbi:glycosyltransferase family 2 protein [Xenophilus arseniciresistens]|uniref:Glycosyltransferase family 2 protein n=1 Tax=Xenophilus arseniciresistens TaxID=1283306 RepID=A0AAE3T024_9BURK|nr:glycosyltransferase family 2 protein [Xenophilus arseniciresistens]MDA7417782.1 glycosyltransferase family 2 protein [Xenophilus arseniciresistens]
MTPANPQAAQPTVSVALCTHNGARYLAEQVRSICAQADCLPMEIVLSDDASRDEGVAVVRQTLAAAGLDGRIALTVFENRPALGVVRNFEQAVRACRGELIALCDQDDVWHPGRLARMAAEFAARPDLLLLHSDARLVDGQLQPLGQSLFEGLEARRDEIEAIQRGEALAVLMHRNLVTGATTVFRRALLEVALPFPREWVHDEWLAALAAATGRVDVIDAALIDYRQHGANQIGARRMTLAEKVRKALAPRGDKYARRVVRMQLLQQRLQALGNAVPDAARALVAGKLVHLRFRAGLPAPRLLRAWPVLRHATQGHYARYDRGWQAIVQDLFEG